MNKKLALNGGEKAITLGQDEALRWPIVGEEDKKRVIQVLEMGSGKAEEGCYAETY